MGLISDIKSKFDKKKTLDAQPKEDAKILEEAYRDFEDAKSSKADQVSLWQRYDDYIEGEQWDAPTPRDEWKPRPVTNICWEKLQTIHANTVGGKVSATLTERQPGFALEAAKMTDVIATYFDSLDFQRKLSEFEWIRPATGCCIFKSPWNPDKKLNGDGDLDLYVVHPANFYPDPNVTNPWHIQRAEFMEFVTRETKRWICGKFSKERDNACRHTKEELEQLIVPEASSDTDIYSSDATTSRETVDLHERWYKDQNDKLQVMWYAGWVLLKDSRDDEESRKNGFYRHGRYPVVWVPYIQKPKRAWGRSELQSLVGESGRHDGLQDIINKIMQSYLVAMQLHAFQQTAYRHGSVKDPEKTLTGEPDLLIPTKGDPREAITKFGGQAPSPTIISVREAVMIDADRVTKQWDITQGRSSTAIKTATQTLALKEEAMKGLDDRVTTLHDGIRELVELWVEHLIEFVTDEREWAKESTDGTKGISSVKFNPSLLGDTRKLAEYRKQHNEEAWSDTPGESRRVYFKVTVDVGNAISMSQAFLFQMGMDLFGAKAIDLKGLYEMLPNFANKQETMERMLTAMQAQQTPPPPTGGDTGAVMPPELVEFVQSLPPEVQAQIMALPDAESRVQAVMQAYEQLQGGVAAGAT